MDTAGIWPVMIVAIVYFLGRWAGVKVGTARAQRALALEWREQLLESGQCPLCGSSFSSDGDML